MLFVPYSPIPLVVTLRAAGSWTWTNMPAALTVLNGDWATVQLIDLARMREARLKVNKLGTAPVNNAKLSVRYYTSYSQTAGDYLTLGTSSVEITMDTGTNKYYDSGWIPLVSGAKAAVYVAAFGISGDGAADPVFGNIVAEFR